MTLMGVGAGDIEEMEANWGRELFDGARGAAEPVWSADLAAITRSGDRRRRWRAAGTGSGLLGLVAVTTAVAVTLGAGSTDYGSAAGPAGGWGGKKLQEVFKYAGINGGGGYETDMGLHVPEAAARDVAAVIGHIDPGGAHLQSGGVEGPDLRLVGPGDSALKPAWALMMGWSWSVDGTPVNPTSEAPGARLQYDFYKSDRSMHATQKEYGGSRTLPQQCGYTFPGAANAFAPSSSPLTKWSECRFTTLPDGSRVGSTTAAFGAGTESVAIRVFPDGNLVVLTGRDYQAGFGMSPDVVGGADPKTVLKPSPWTEDGLRAALSDPEIRPAFRPATPPNADAKLVAPTDLGSDWAYDLGGGSSTTGEFVIENGCVPDHNVFGLAAGRGQQYHGTLPGGWAATAFEGEYRLPKGTGAATVQDARKYAQGGCDPKAGPAHSQDTVVELPSGIGDEAFVENQPQQGMVRVTVRFGDTVLQVMITRSDTKPVDAASAEGRAYLTGVARQAAARWTADSAPKPGKG